MYLFVSNDSNITQYFSGDEIEFNYMGGSCSTYGERGDFYRVLVGKSDGERLLGTSGLGWEDNVTMDLQEVGCGTWTGLI
jgi:hypothetical protein